MPIINDDNRWFRADSASQFCDNFGFCAFMDEYSDNCLVCGFSNLAPVSFKVEQLSKSLDGYCYNCFKFNYKYTITLDRWILLQLFQIQLQIYNNFGGCSTLELLQHNSCLIMFVPKPNNLFRLKFKFKLSARCQIQIWLEITRTIWPFSEISED